MDFNRLLRITPKALTIVALMACNLGRAQRATPHETVIHSFQGDPDGLAPYGALIHDDHGNLYGTTSEGGEFGLGTVFEVTPGHNRGTQTVLYSFQGTTAGDGATPYASLVLDREGNLYGTTSAGGNQPGCPECGTVFKLAPPQRHGSGWTESVIYSFSGLDGAYPAAGLTFDERGNLYGTTLLGGTSFFGAVFELSRSAGSWTEQVIYSFTGSTDGALPFAGIVRAGDEKLYGTTISGGAYGGGVVFELVKHRSAPWSQTVLYSFTGGADGYQPVGGLILNSQGRLDGTTFLGGDPSCSGGCGTVYQLSPPSHGTSWTFQTLYAFTGGADGAQPFAGLTAERSGKLLGVASAGGSSSNCFDGCGTVFALTPPARGQTGWSESTIYGFDGGSADGASPVASLLVTEEDGTFGVTTNGGPHDAGTVFRLNPR